MKYNLSAIQDTLFDITNAITSVINVDVTIADSNLNRITATGIYMSRLGKKLSNKCVFSKSLNSGESFIIENPRENKRCIDCDNISQCKEYAQVCCPIIVNNTAVGVIGLVAFNEVQKKRIVGNEINLLDFLKKMSDLIASKLLEHESNNRIKKLANELDTTMNLINVGIISTDEKGFIIRSNKTVQKYFDSSSVSNGNNIKNILSDFKPSNTITVKNKSFNYYKNNRKFQGFYSIHPIKVNNEINGYVVTINKLEEMLNVFGTIASTSREITFDCIIGKSTKLNEIINYAKQFAKSTSSVLIQGESGTGKELFARAIHNHSSRKEYPFIAINCSALPENLIESELFGYEEGAFTGAKKGGNPGKFELAGKGTIFLDEIGDMPLHLQSKLLRVIQERSYMRVGGSKSIYMEARIISATNRNLEKMVNDGEFREDLFFRLNVIPLYIPPLRNRKEDIMLISYKFLNKFSKQFNKHVNEFDDNLINFLIDYNWPGNIRELENTIEYIVNVASSSTVTIDNLPNRLKKNVIKSDINKDWVKKDINGFVKPLKEIEKQEIEKALHLYGRNNVGIEKSAAALGIGRATLYRKIKTYNI